MEEKIENTIAIKVQAIKDIDQLIERVKDNQSDDLRVSIETKHWYGYDIPSLEKRKHRLYSNKETLIDILERVKRKEQEDIDKLIDKEVEKRKDE